MTHEPSAWRTNDAVRFDVAREAVNTATAALFQLADSGAIAPETAIERARGLRLALQRLDGFDRQAVDAFIDGLAQRPATTREASA